MTQQTRLEDLTRAVAADVKALTQSVAAVGGVAGAVPLFVQQTDPLVASPYVWYKTDATGKVIDILKG